MVSARCKTVVKEELKKMGLHFMIVDLGEVDVMENISTEQREHLKVVLNNAGLELIDDKRAILVEKIKNTIIKMVHQPDEVIKIKFSDYLSEKLNHDYTYMSNLFTEVQGTTIMQYLISHKIEHIKELLIYGELTISEIAWQMNYSSVAHLSNQFKKITGFTPSHFKQLKEKRRRPLEEIGNSNSVNEMDDERTHLPQIEEEGDSAEFANKKIDFKNENQKKSLQIPEKQQHESGNCQSEKTKCIDLHYLIHLTKSKPELMMEMISLYLEQTPPLIHSMNASLKNKDWNSLHAAVHKIIPSISIMGISKDFENIAKTVQENAVTQQYMDELPALVKQLDVICTQACKELKEEFNTIKYTNS